jgi:hypothetical protein
MRQVRRSVRRPLCFAMCLATVALAHAATAQADVDLTGNWLLVLSLPGISLPVTIVQNGTLLSVSGGASVPTATGTIDPATGAFSVASSSPACNDLTLQGVAAPDGNSLSGTGTLEATDSHGFCDPLPFSFTAARALCPPGLAPRDTDGDGIPDACDVCPASTPADPSLAVSRVRVQLFAGTAPRVQVTASGKDASFAGTLPTMPLALHVVLDPPAVTSSTCGAVTFAGPGSDPPRCEVGSRGTTLVCR